MARQSKADKAIDRQVEAAYGRHFNCVPVNMMDLGKIMKLGRQALTASPPQDLDAAMIAAVTQFRTDGE